MDTNVQDVTGLKLCKKCGQMLPLASFGKNSVAKDKLHYICKPCASKIQHEYRSKNRDHINQWLREWRAENREHVNQQRRKWYAENRETMLQRQTDQYQNDPIFLRKRIVRDMTMKAVYRGDLTRPDECSQCGSNEFQIEAHHASYEPGDELNITWLCAPCHRKLHRTNDD